MFIAAVLHLYFARFISHFLHLLDWLPQREPFKRLLVQGMVMGRSYRVKGTGKYLKPEEIDFSGIHLQSGLCSMRLLSIVSLFFVI